MKALRFFRRSWRVLAGASLVQSLVLAGSGRVELLSRQPARASPLSEAGALDPTPARHLVPEGKSIAAEQILSELFAGKDVALKGCIIEGSLDPDQAETPGDERRTSLRVIGGQLALDSCRVSGNVNFRRCVFVRPLDLSGTEIRGNLDLGGSELLGGFKAPRLRVVGQLRLSGSMVAADLDLRESRIGDRVDMTDLQVLGSLVLENADLRDELEIGKALIGSIAMGGARLAGRVKLRDILILGDMASQHAVFGRELSVESLRVLGCADLTDAGGPASIALSDITVGGDLLLGLSARGPLAIAGLRVGRELSLFEGRFASMLIEKASVTGRTEFEGAAFAGKVVIRDTDFGVDFSALDAVFDGECAFTKVHFPGRDPLEGAFFSHAPALVDTALPSAPAVRSAVTEDDEEAGEEALEDGYEDDTEP